MVIDQKNKQLNQIICILKCFEIICATSVFGLLAIFFYTLKQTAAILELCAKYWSNDLKGTVNKYLEFKLARNNKTHIRNYLSGTSILFLK